MASAMEPMRTTVKLSLADETHRVTLDTATLSFDALRALVPSTFAAAPPPQDWTLVYTDNEGDLVTVASAAEFDEARRVLLDLDTPVATDGNTNTNSSSARAPTMHFRVVATVSVADQFAPAVLHAVDELSRSVARLASDTRDSIAQCAYLERGRAMAAHSASKTCELFGAARREATQRLRVVQTRIAGEIERRRASVDSEASAAVPNSSDSSSSSAADMDGSSATRHSQHVLDTDAASSETHSDDDADDSDDEPDVQAVTPGAAPRAAADAALVESDAETAASDSDDDPDGSDDEWAVVPAAWSTEVALVRSILPHVHVDDCVAMLRKHGGDLEAAINELTDA